LLAQFNGLKGQFPDPSGTKRVLIWRGPGGITASLAIELVIASALAQRNVDVRFVLCDGVLSGCLRRSVDSDPVNNWPMLCSECYRAGKALIEASGFPYQNMGEWVPPSRRAHFRALAGETALADVPSWRYKGVPVGQYALSSTIRYLKGREKTQTGDYDRILREYFYSGLVCAEAAAGAIEELEATHVLMQHGIYVDWGPAFGLALSADIPVARWMRGYLRNHLHMRTSMRDDIKHIHYLGDDKWRTRASRPLSPLEETRLDRYMDERALGTKSSQQLFDEAPLGVETISECLDLPTDKQVWGIFPHLTWDGVFAFEPIPFRDPTAWVLETVEAISELTDTTWIIKIHPAERVFGTVRGVQQAISECFPKLPSHVRLIPAESGINTYGLLPLLNGGITIRGTVGLELAILGKPVILAGEAHYGAKGFTHDGHSREEYFALLRQASSLSPLSQDQIDLARRYAHNFLIERQIPFEFVSGNGSRLEFDSFDDLVPGRNAALDMICERITGGGEFILDGEHIHP
jgi:hypothetical protein